MILSQTSITLIEETIKTALRHYNTGGEQSEVTDIHLQPVQGSGELALYDDEDNLLAQATIDEWTTYQGEDFNSKVEQQLTVVLNTIKEAGTLDHLSIMKPYSFVMIDEDKETLAELLLVDDDTVLLNEELLKGLDEELDEFLKKLLED